MIQVKEWNLNLTLGLLWTEVIYNFFFFFNPLFSSLLVGMFITRLLIKNEIKAGITGLSTAIILFIGFQIFIDYLTTIYPFNLHLFPPNINSLFFLTFIAISLAVGGFIARIKRPLLGYIIAFLLFKIGFGIIFTIFAMKAFGV